jgi:hypothetical protein
MIRSWAEAHHKSKGRRPDSRSGAVKGAPGEDRVKIDAALRRGHRGLPGGTSLRVIFGRSPNPYARGVRPKLTVEQVLAWADAYREIHGRWPVRTSGLIPGAPGEKWANIDEALRHGRRGLPSGLSLTRLFALPRDAAPGPAPRTEGDPT